MEFRAHGANPDKLYAQFGIPRPATIMDFSTNVNAVPQRPGFVPDMDAALRDYPDDECAELRALISSQTASPENELLVTAGANEAIFILASIFSGMRNYILEPVYGEYERALLAYGSKPQHIFELSACALPSGSVIWLCNPCNPTGSCIAEADLAAFASANSGCTFIVDEAYRDFIWDRPPEPRPQRLPNVIRLRSLTKTYDLCGARVGYVDGPGRTIAAMKKRQPSWSVSALAQQAAFFYMSDGDILKRTRAWYAAEMPRLIGALLEGGMCARQTSVNFFLLETCDDERLLRFLLERGIVLRHTRNFPGLDGRFVRAAARGAADNDMLVSALCEYRRSLGGAEI